MISNTPSVDRHFFMSVASAMTRIGVDVPSFCLQQRLSNPLDEPGERIPLALVAPLYERIGETCGDPEFIYKVGTGIDFTSAGTLFHLVTCCATMLDALQLVSRYSAVASDVVKCSFSNPLRTHVSFIVTPNPHVQVTTHQVEGVLHGLKRFQQATPASHGPLIDEIWFRHAPRFSVEHYEQHFGCSVRFHQSHNGARLQRKALALSFPGADDRLKSYYCNVLEKYELDVMSGDTLEARAQLLFTKKMAFGEPAREVIARELNTSVRNLQRQLQRAGTSYRQVTEQARLVAARQELLNSDRPMHEIAFLLGYSDSRVFRRAFKRWTGMSPVDFRRHNGKA